MKKIVFTQGAKYNAMQLMSDSALANGYAPDFYAGIKFIRSYSENDVDYLEFDNEGEVVTFDADFVNNQSLRGADNEMLPVYLHGAMVIVMANNQ